MAWSCTKTDEIVILSVPDAKVVGTVALPFPPKQAPRRDVAAEFGMIGLLGSGDGSDDTLLMAPDGKAVVAITPDGKAHLVDLAARALVKSHVPPPKAASSASATVVIEPVL